MTPLTAPGHLGLNRPPPESLPLPGWMHPLVHNLWAHPLLVLFPPLGRYLHDRTDPVGDQWPA